MRLSKRQLRDLLRHGEVTFSSDHFWQARRYTQSLDSILSEYQKYAQQDRNRKAFSDLKKARKLLSDIVGLIQVISEL